MQRPVCISRRAFCVWRCSGTKACRLQSERMPGGKGEGMQSEGGRGVRAQGKGGKAHEACGSSASSGGIFGSLLFTGMRGHEEPGEKGGMRRPCREKDDTGERIDLCVVASRERGRKDRATAEGAAGENERGRKKGEECRGLESWDEEERACGASALRGRIEIVRERGDKKAARARGETLVRTKAALSEQEAHPWRGISQKSTGATTGERQTCGEKRLRSHAFGARDSIPS